MTDKPTARPRQVSLLGFTILLGSAFVVLLAFQQMATLGSIEAQESAERLVSEPPGDGLGITADQVQSILRVLCVIAGGSATAAAILGWYVLRRTRSARLALSVLAPVLLVTGIATAGFLTAVVVAAIAMLWVQPARDWFAGREPARHPALATTSDARAELPKAPPQETPRDTMTAMSQPPTYAPGPYSESPRAAAPQRPGAVLAAGITTIVSSAVVLAGTALALLLMLAERASFEETVSDELAGNSAYDDIEPGTLVDVLVGVMVVCAVWAVVAIVLAVLAMRGSNVARITLVVSSIASALVSLIGILAIVPVLFTAAGIAVAVLLLRGDVQAWYAARRRP